MRKKNHKYEGLIPDFSWQPLLLYYVPALADPTFLRVLASKRFKNYL